jgi:hypothetical protein
MNWGYVAGFFDGEGCLTFSYESKQVAPRIEISNCNSDTLEAQRTFTGNLGHINPYKPRRRHSGLLPKYTKNTRPIWRWDIAHRDDVQTFLENIKSFLIIKKDLAELALVIIANNDYSKCSHKLHRVDQKKFDANIGKRRRPARNLVKSIKCIQWRFKNS